MFASLAIPVAPPEPKTVPVAPPLPQKEPRRETRPSPFTPPPFIKPGEEPTPKASVK